MSDAVTLRQTRRWLLEDCACLELFNTCIVFSPNDSQEAFQFKSLRKIEKLSDIILLVDPLSPALKLSLRYASSALNSAHADNITTTLEHITHCLTHSPGRPLADSCLLSKHNQNQIARWNGGAPAGPLDSCIHTLFRLQCMLQPDAQAICAWDGTLTYRELDRLSSTVQWLLQPYNLTTDSVVPILFKKSKWAVVAMLGVLKAGAAFSMLDQSYPTKRLVDICENSDAKVIICSQELSIGVSGSTLLIGDHNLEKAAHPAIQPVKTASHDAAYVVYTSGSTGAPKGIIIEHGSFCTNAIASSQAQNLDQSSRVLLFASYAFDVSIHESLTPLLLGGCVCIPSESQRVNSLKEAVRSLRVNWVELTPSVARLWQPDDIPTVKTLVMGGEPMLPNDISLWKDKLLLVCAYGPAECTIVSTVQSCVQDPGNIGLSPCGTCWITSKDNHHQLLPVGCVGELIIGGPIVGRGYLKQPCLTANAFITNPEWASLFHLNDSCRFYKTGDLVRYNSNGTIAYIGRKDTQIKLNGQRVELGEVEHQALHYFRNVVITAEVAAPAGRKPILILFIAPKLECSAHIDCAMLLRPPSVVFQEKARETNTLLRDVLPRHMIPAAYIELSAIPISRTGKVDRKVLREAIERISENDFRAYYPIMHNDTIHSPSTPILDQLRRLFSAVLGIPEEKIRPSDSFFQLGGDSVSAIRLVGSARDQGLQMTVESVFKQQTISKLQDCTRQTSSGIELPIPAFSLLDPRSKPTYIVQAAEQCSVFPEQIEDIYPCTPLQEALMAYTSKRPGAFQAQFHFQLPQQLDIPRLKEAWRIVIAANPILRTRIVHSHNGALQVVLRQGEPSRWDLVHGVNKSPGRLMSYGVPLVTLAITDNVGGKSPTFCLTMHHAIFDGWSYALILGAVEDAYKHLNAVQRPFAPFIEHILNCDYESAQHFWVSEFKDMQAVPFPVPPFSFGHMANSIITMHRQIHVSEWLGGSCTPSTIIQLAFALLIAWRTGSMDVLFGLTVTGRNAPVAGVHRTTGPTIATFPLRTMLSGTLNIADALALMQNHIAMLIPFEQTGLRRIKSYGTETARACQFQSLLIIQPATYRRSSEIFVEFESNEHEQSKFSTCPLTLVCELGTHTLSVKAMFDNAVVIAKDMERLLDQFEYLIDMTIKSPTLEIRSIITSPSDPYSYPLRQSQSWSSYIEKKAYDFLGGDVTVIVDAIAPNGGSKRSTAIFLCETKRMREPTKISRLFIRPTEKVRWQFQRLIWSLGRFLPCSMVPSLCLPVSFIPFNPLGQPDRLYLCEAASSMTLDFLNSLMDPVKCIDHHILPEEVRLRGIVAQALGMDPQNISPKDDFFTLGGDSISAMQVVSLCRKHQLSLTALDIFDGRTIEQIASSLRPLTSYTPPSTPGSDRSLDTRFSLLSLTSDRGLERLESVLMATYDIKSMDSIEDVYPCSESHQGLLQTQTLRPFHYQSYTIWEVTTSSKLSPVCPVRLRNAWFTLARRHPALRTHLIDSPLCDGSNSKAHVVHKEYITDVLILSCEDKDVIAELRKPFLPSGTNISYPHAFSICQTVSGRVFCKLEGGHAFLDAASVLIILRELAQAYDGQLSSFPGPLYSSAVAWLQGLPNRHNRIDYWRRQLEGASPCIFPRLRCQDSPSKTLVVTKQLASTATLIHFCTTHGLTVSNVLQVAWGLILRRYTESNDVCFGTLISGRDSRIPDVDSIIGPFFNVLVCQLHFGREDSLLDILRRNQIETGNRLVNQHCSLIEILRFSGYFGQPLFNTCISVEQPLSMDSSDASLCFKDLETLEPTEYGIIATITIGPTDVGLGLTYKSDLLTGDQALAVADRFRMSITDITGSLNNQETWQSVYIRL
ncbi:nonribosomal peptide synthase [Aspergillus bombycis]|uniref:Nonribosomal peptide synthase n=1 Tax=Aspergillus bombycis TaxID=109264 RepID=A0A1F8AAJ9_9EURO|nr:nonribosomal peptide synthase [Aspergillus bombycis]OGM48348.1 nonribosomal peptide synthase [Aspergillus bombycis]